MYPKKNYTRKPVLGLGLSETEIQRRILTLLKTKYRELLPILYRSNNIPVYDLKVERFRKLGTFAQKGLSDITGVLKGGRAFYIEVKKTGQIPKARPVIKRFEIVSKEKQRTIDQWDFIESVNKAGGLAFYADSPNTADDILQKIKCEIAAKRLAQEVLAL